MNIQYEQHGDDILAIATSDDGTQTWDHYLNNDERWFYTNEPATCDAKMAVAAQAQFDNQPPAPPAPVNLRSATVDPTVAATTVANRDTLKAQLESAKAQIISAVEALPIDRVQAIISQVQALLEG